MSKSSRAKHNLGLANLRHRRNLAESRGYSWFDYVESELEMVKIFVYPIKQILNYDGLMRRIFKIASIKEFEKEVVWENKEDLE